MAPPGSLRDQLRSLRIDRPDEPQTPRGPGRRIGRIRWIGWLAGGIAASSAAAVALRVLAAPPLAVHVAGVRVASPGEAAAAPVLSGVGYVVTGDKYIAIGVRVPGRIRRYLVDEGDHVELGQPLVELDPRDYKAQVGRAEAQLRLARANRNLARSQLERVRKLYQAEIASQEELDQAVSRSEVGEASVSQAESELAQARVNLEDTVLRSPVRGVVLAKLKGLGEVAVPGGFSGSGDLLRVADLSELRAEVDVSEADLGHVKLGQAAEIAPDAYPDKRYAARVVKLYPQINRQKGTLKVEVRIERPDALLLPDMSVRVTFLAAPPPSAAGPNVLVPRAAVRPSSAGAYVWVVQADRVRRRPVDTGAEVGEDLAVLRGLQGGESVVVGSDEGLAENARVRRSPP